METGPEVKQSPVIVRPEDSELLEKLNRKASEYLTRIGDEYTHPGQAIVMGLAVGNITALDAYIKHRLLSQVLDEGSVETWEFTKKIMEDPIIKDISEVALPTALQRTQVACEVIDAYCSNNLSATIGGTGLM